MKIAAFYENIAEGAKYERISTKEAVRKLISDGLDLLYISSMTLEHNGKEVEEVLSETGIGVEGIHGFCDLGHYPQNHSYEEMILNAARLHAGNVLIVPGMIEDGEDWEAITANMIAGMKNAVKFGAQYGIAVSMEDFDGLKVPYCTIEGLAKFMDSVPGLLCSFDTGNFIMYGQDEMSALQLFQDKLCTIHLKDRKKEAEYSDDHYKVCNDGSKVYAAAVGSGYMKIREILEQLIRRGYSGNGIVELYDYSSSHMLQGISDSVKWVKRQLALLEEDNVSENIGTDG